jgi:hypothetical protein
VVALLVVLDEDLPVGGHDVVVVGADAQSLGLVDGDEGLEPGEVVVERRGAPRDVDEDEPVPFLGGQLDQPVLRGVEIRPPLEAWRAAQGAVEVVRPRMVRAHHDVEVARLAAGEKFVSAVPARVGEAVQAPVLGAHQEHPGGADRLGALIGDLGDILTARHAHPPAAEEVVLLPLEHRLVDVRRSGE